MKPWEKPKLIVLVRSQPEEALVMACKAANDTGTNPGQRFQSGCQYWAPDPCGPCYSPVTS
jgi:hypothetical protein